MTRILVWHPVQGDAYAAALRARLPAAAADVARDEAEFARLLPQADALLGFQFPLAPFAQPRRLRWIHLTAAGADCLAPLRERLAGIVVTNSRGIHGAPIAEYALAAMTALQSDLPAFWRAQQARRWERRPVHTLQGRTLVIVGVGAIGGDIATRASALGMRALGVNRSGAPAAACARTYAVADIGDALAQADFVVVTLPLTDETRHVVGEREFAATKAGAWLVNVGRGGVVDEAALLDALRAGRLAGACLDVFEQEPLPPDHPLWSQPNVIVTPHVAGWRVDYVDRVLDIFLANLARFEANEPLANVFDLARGY